MSYYEIEFQHEYVYMNFPVVCGVHCVGRRALHPSSAASRALAMAVSILQVLLPFLLLASDHISPTLPRPS